MASAASRLLRGALAAQDPVAYLREQAAKERQHRATVSRRAAPRREKVAEKKQQRRERMGEIHRQVWERANGQCEAWIPTLSASENPRGDRCPLMGRVVDHWEGGVGRRRLRESVATCWLLCESHDRGRTANYPSAMWWNLSRELHCNLRGLPFVPHIVNEAEDAR